MKLTKNQLIAIIVAIVAVVAIIIGVVVLGGDKKDEPVATTPDQVVVPDTTEEEPFELEFNAEGQVRSFLTGEFVDEEKGLRRPLALMVENTKEAIPQYGLGSASVIYESPVEGSITRLMAIFEDWDNLEVIGNVRSCRPYYVYFANEFNAIYAHAGQSIHGKVLLETGIIDDLNGVDDTAVVNAMFFRSSKGKAPHNLYTSGEGVNKGIALKGYSTSYADGYTGHFKFATDEENTLSKGEDCEAFKMYYFYNHPYFIYDKESGLYKRYQFKGAQIDGNTNEQLTAKNIIIQNVDYSMYEQTQYLNITVTGTGTGKYITNGKMIDITWQKASEYDQTHYYDADGKEIKLNPGVTWVLISQNEFAEKSSFYASESEFKSAQ